jgi:hypothetical protein
VKFFRFSTDTATLLRRYFDGERRSHDSTNWRLADYLSARDDKLTDLNKVPMFLSTRGTQLKAKSFRETYWVPACRAVGMDADPHQARHWHVTMALRAIHETSNTEGEVRRRIRELIEYMQWRGGEETMAAYDHYLDAARHADSRINCTNDCASPCSKASSGDRRAPQPRLRRLRSSPALTRT